MMTTQQQHCWAIIQAIHLIFSSHHQQNQGNLTKAIKVYSDGHYCPNERSHGDFGDVLGYQYYQSMIRLYHEVFLIYNKKVKQWFLMRIFVP
eukprot:gnl/Chilomastix_caulleri/4195.p1 GENE.gnl/Chilomastix_caulleri/4195~~gnl/Chilomastix_caulleri/4195.p1  ORF type:complete len:92 (-),score=16.21 gnl/Chilomastix_caulleri/4195:308-583(-)